MLAYFGDANAAIFSKINAESRLTYIACWATALDSGGNGVDLGTAPIVVHELARKLHLLTGLDDRAFPGKAFDRAANVHRTYTVSQVHKRPRLPFSVL
jgi:hypothetical protein